MLSIQQIQLLEELRRYRGYMGANGDWDFRISDLVKNPDETDIQPL